jgi:hypothetical protein
MTRECVMMFAVLDAGTYQVSSNRWGGCKGVCSGKVRCCQDYVMRLRVESDSDSEFNLELGCRCYGGSFGGKKVRRLSQPQVSAVAATPRPLTPPARVHMCAL